MTTPITLTRRPWHARLWRIYAGLRGLGYGRIEAMRMAWAMAWPMVDGR